MSITWSILVLSGWTYNIIDTISRISIRVFQDQLTNRSQKSCIMCSITGRASNYMCHQDLWVVYKTQAHVFKILVSNLFLHQNNVMKT